MKTAANYEKKPAVPSQFKYLPNGITGLTFRLKTFDLRLKPVS